MRRSAATIEKYRRDLLAFYGSLPVDKRVDKSRVLAYKEGLMARYAASSVNSMLAAINGFFRHMEWYECRVRSVRTQHSQFRGADKELTKADYERLLAASRRGGNRRLTLIMQTICATGIQVSELEFITVEALGVGRAVVRCKGKVRTILLPRAHCGQLRQYVRERGTVCGPVFVTRGGKPVNRSNIWADMKRLCEGAGVAASKVFPHNLRHLIVLRRTSPG